MRHFLLVSAGVYRDVTVLRLCDDRPNQAKPVRGVTIWSRVSHSFDVDRQKLECLTAGNAGWAGVSLLLQKRGRPTAYRLVCVAR